MVGKIKIPQAKQNKKTKPNNGLVQVMDFIFIMHGDNKTYISFDLKSVIDFNFFITILIIANREESLNIGIFIL